MPEGVSTTDRAPSLGEEIANSVSHGVGFLLYGHFVWHAA